MNKKFYIDYPQERVAEGVNVYRCKFCKIHCLVINGQLANHADNCQFKLENTK